MSYTALYRKFRPSNFDDVKGQDGIVTTLKNQIKSGRLSHAYLFCGTRGTGKTTVAKILAKAVNCENLNDGSPCDNCNSCKAINSGASINVVEIDAASNNGVDNIRNIREEIKYPPTEGKYKVYIIDEVHMLSTGAFNALLKTLEEPPEYVIFILATTESHKVPTTITSRCQRYNFKRISIDTIVARLADLMKIENINVEDKALRYIAKLGDGSMRDSLSLLDRCIAFYMNEDITYDKVLEALGAVDTTVYENLLNAVINKNSSQVIKVIGNMINEGREVSQLLSDFIWYLRNLLIVNGANNIEDILDVSSENLDSLKEMAAKLDSQTILRYIMVLSNTSDKLRFSTQKRVLLEVAFIKLMQPETENDNLAITERLKEVENKIQQGVGQVIVKEVAVAAEGTVSTPVAKPKLPSAVPDDIKEIVKNYRKLVSAMGNPMKVYLSNSKVTLSQNGNLGIVLENKQIQELVTDKKSEIESFFTTKLQKDVHVDILGVSSGRQFDDEFVNLEDFIKMDVEVADI